MEQIGFAVNETGKTLLSPAVRMENAKETKGKQADQNCRYFLVINKETDTLRVC